MRLSYSTLALLDQTGDEAAHTILVAWGSICGILWETTLVSAHYRAQQDYLVLRVEDNFAGTVAAPCRWWSTHTPLTLTLEHPIIHDTSYWYQKGR